MWTEVFSFDNETSRTWAARTLCFGEPSVNAIFGHGLWDYDGSRPVSPIEGAILDGFSNVFGSDLRSAFEIGDGAGDFQNAIVRAGAEPLLRHRALEQPLAVGGKLAVVADLLDPICAFE